MEKLKKLIFNNGFILVVIFSLPAIRALLVPGFFGASDDMHIAWLYEMDKAVKIGQIPPRFVPDLSFGFGYPLFNFVFPLPFYLAEIFHLLNFSLVDSIKVVFLLSIPLSMYFMYKLLKEFTSQWLSLAGAVVFGFTPYRSTDIYVRGAIGESLAFVFLPLLTLASIKLTSSTNQSSKNLNLFWMGSGGLALTALILTHNITAYMFVPFWILLIILRLIFLKLNRTKVLLQLIFMSALGLLGSIYFWLPAITESKLMVYDTVFNYVDHFPTISQLLLPYWGYGASTPGPGDGMSFFIGSLNLAIMILGSLLLVLFWRKYSIEHKILLAWVVICFILAFVMMNFRSLFLWQHLPLLPYFQFPWRFLIITTFVSPLMLISISKLKFSNYLAIAVIVLGIGLNFSFFRPHDFLGREDGYFLNRYIPVPQASEEYLKTGEEYLRLPVSTQKRPDKNYPLVSLNEGVKKITEINDLNTSLEIVSGDNFVLSYNKYFYPGWEAKLDGELVAIKPGEPFGQITVNIPAGSHQLNLLFTETTTRKILNIVSLLTLLVSLVFLKIKISRYNV